MKALADFIASRRYCADLGERFGAEFFEDAPRAGYIFAGDFYVEQERDGTFYLILGRCEYRADALHELEPVLYAYAITEAPELFGLVHGVHAFVCALQDAMATRLAPNSGDNFAKAIAANMREDNPAVCHMHDYCDANAVALQVTGGDMGAAEALYDRARPVLRGRA